MESIALALSKNKELPASVKEDVLVITDLLIRTFALDEKVIAERLSNMSIKKMPKYSDFEDIKSINTTVFINPNSIHSGKSTYMQMVLKYLFPNNCQNLSALYNGAIQCISNAGVGSSNTSDEYVFCNLLSKVMESDMNKPEPIMTALFSGNISSCLPILEDKGISNKEVLDLMNLADHNYMVSKNSRKCSNLASIERILLNFKVRQNPSLEELTDFVDSMQLNSSYYGPKRAHEYTELEVLRLECEELLSTYSNKKDNSKTL